VFNHGLRSKYSKKHPWEFFREIAIANKNRKINTIRHSIGRSFDLSIVEKEENCDLFDEFLSLVRLYDKSSFATLSEKMYTFVLCALNRRKLHLFWKVISTYDKLVSQWYTESSFVNSPGKNQIFCLLAPLSQLPFYFEGNIITNT